MSPIRALVAVGLLAPLAVLAEVGKVEVLDGAATRTPQGGSEAALAAGAAIEVGDTLTVRSGTLAVRLSDESVLALDEGSSLRIDEADFGDLDARKFSARLLLGALWAKVAPLVVGSGAKFEISTDRAIAGVRGTEFSVEITPETAEGIVIGVEEGEVAVDEVEEAAPAAAAEAGTPAGSGTGTRMAGRGKRAAMILKPGRAWVSTRHGVVPRKFAMHSGRLTHFVGKHKAIWKKRMLEGIRERQVKLRLKQQELRAKEKLHPENQEALRAKEKALREKQNELREKAKEIRRK